MHFLQPLYPKHDLSFILCCPGGNHHGVFALGLVQDEWKMYVKRPLDREKCNFYIINITASDGLFVCQTTVEVTVIDTNDNSPMCDQVRDNKKKFQIFQSSGRIFFNLLLSAFCVSAACVHFLHFRGPSG